MRNFILIVLVCLGAPTLSAQSIYPQDYFKSPVDVDIFLAGTFAELRPNHFHSGIDIKTQQREGLNIYAAASGYISRIKIQHFGFGKALYVTHPNGYTTVYAHLKRFAPKIEALVKAKQYETESYEVELFPKASTLKVESGELIAYSGNTGSSGGPHLHFEVRDENQHPINPMHFGYRVTDTRTPTINGLYAYPLSENAHVNNLQQRTKIRLKKLKPGVFTTNPVSISGEVGFAIATIDKQNYTHNKNGVFNIKTTLNGNPIYEIDYSTFSFGETRNLNRLIDFELYKTDRVRAQKLYKDPKAPLSLVKPNMQSGAISLEDGLSGVYAITVTDYEGNTAIINVNLDAKKPVDSSIKPINTAESNPNVEFISATKNTVIKRQNVSVIFDANTFYDDFNAKVTLKTDTIHIHEDVLPLKKSYHIQYDFDNATSEDLKQLYVAKLHENGRYSNYVTTKKHGNALIGSTRSLGTYTVATDTKPPKIKPLNFSNNKWISNNKTLKLKIEDDDSGISKFRATVNGKWILMEYEYKDDMLTHHFSDAVLTETENNFKLIVTDNVGNSTIYEAVFYRK